jgi:hypothetical protein
MLNDINPAHAPEYIRKGYTVSKPILYRMGKYLTPEAIEQAKLQHEAREDAAFEARCAEFGHDLAEWDGDV